MAVIGVILAVIAFLICQSLIMNFVPEDFKYWLISVVPAAWVAWPFFRASIEHRFSKLSPRARIYDLPVARTFQKIVAIFDESAIEGRRFDVFVRDTNTKRIAARIRWTEDASSFQGHGTGPANMSWSSRTESKDHCLHVEVRLKEVRDKTVVVIDWTPEKGGHGCYKIVDSTMELIYQQLGEGEPYESDAPRTYLPGPPIFLVVASVVGCLIFFDGINNHLEQRKAVYQARVDELNSLDDSNSKERNAQQIEINLWNSFKQRNNIK